MPPSQPTWSEIRKSKLIEYLDQLRKTDSNHHQQCLKALLRHVKYLRLKSQRDEAPRGSISAVARIQQDLARKKEIYNLPSTVIVEDYSYLQGKREFVNFVQQPYQGAIDILNKKNAALYKELLEWEEQHLSGFVEMLLIAKNFTTLTIMESAPALFTSAILSALISLYQSEEFLSKQFNWLAHSKIFLVTIAVTLAHQLVIDKVPHDDIALIQPRMHCPYPKLLLAAIPILIGVAQSVIFDDASIIGLIVISNLLHRFMKAMIEPSTKQGSIVSAGRYLLSSLLSVAVLVIAVNLYESFQYYRYVEESVQEMTSQGNGVSIVDVELAASSWFETFLNWWKDEVVVAGQYTDPATEYRHAFRCVGVFSGPNISYDCSNEQLAPRLT